MAKPSKHRLIPYKILMIALYGKMPWISRDSLGVVRLPVPKLSAHLRVRAGDVNEAIDTLQAWMLIEGYRWWGSFVEITTSVPQGMCLLIEAPKMRGPTDKEPIVLEAEESVQR